MSASQFLIEACVESLKEALSAEAQGAHRIELCSRLDLDGLTPSRKLIREVIQALNIPVNVMIRPRAGNFVYSHVEIEKMQASIKFCKEIGANGVVFGILDNQNEVDITTTRILAELASPMQVTFHKAIDEVPDPIASVKVLNNIPSVTGILTSGQAKTAKDGHLVIKAMAKATLNHLTIIAAGKITNKNLENLHKLIGVNAYHGRKITGNLNN
ncbi:MAG: copper homeostasis protein CutC [Bacteroidota bacterium]